MCHIWPADAVSPPSSSGSFPRRPPAGRLMSITLSAPPFPSTHLRPSARTPLCTPKTHFLSLCLAAIYLSQIAEKRRGGQQQLGSSHFSARQIKDVKRNCCDGVGDVRMRPPEVRRKREGGVCPTEADHFRGGKEKKSASSCENLRARRVNAKRPLAPSLGGGQRCRSRAAITAAEQRKMAKYYS